MSVNVLYTAKAFATGGRDGYAQTEDGSFKVKLATPTELGGDGNGHNPEQIFAAGYSACFLGAMKFFASQNKHLSVPEDAKVSTSVGIGPREAGGFGITAAIEVSLPGVDAAAAQELVNGAHEQICPYSHATRNNVDVKVSIV